MNRINQMLRSWSTRDILVLVALSIVVSLLTIVSAALRTFLEASFGPFGNRMTTMLSILILFIIPYIMRKPSSALLGAILSGLIQLPFSPFGLVSMIGFFVGGVIAEAFFASGRYKNYTPRFILTIAVIYSFISLAFIWVPQQIGQLEMAGQIGILIASLIGGLLGGWFTLLIGSQIIKSGVMQTSNSAEDVESL